MDGEVGDVRAVRVDRAADVALMPEREEWLRARDQHVAPDVELAVLQQQRVRDVALDDSSLFRARRSCTTHSTVLLLMRTSSQSVSQSDMCTINRRDYSQRLHNQSQLRVQ